MTAGAERPFDLPVRPPVEPMLSKLEDELPKGGGWLYEPKWDGFRAIVFRDRERMHIGSRGGRGLDRYFPDLLAIFQRAFPLRCVVDGEIVINGPRGLDFEALLQRIHPAPSRVRKLAAETPASFVAFDLLVVGDEDLRARPFAERRARLASMLEGAKDDKLAVTPQTDSYEQAQQWLASFGHSGFDGVVAKHSSLVYTPGERVMVKVKRIRTADCVVGGYRLDKKGTGIGSLLLGLYDEDGVLQHIGHTSAFKAKERRDILAMLKPLEGGTSFGEGRTPGGPSRWAQGRARSRAQETTTSWIPVRPELVCEVGFDHVDAGAIRHGARFFRWRPDKPPRECLFAQLEK